MDIKEYLPLYLGQIVSVKNNHKESPVKMELDEELLVQISYGAYDSVQLNLRRLPGMKESECVELFNLLCPEKQKDEEYKVRAMNKFFKGYYTGSANISGIDWAKVINACRKMGFDMDALISAGLAVEKK